MPALRDALSRLAGGQDLSDEEAQSAVSEIIAGESSEATVASFLTALRVKGETPDELAGAVRAVRQQMIALEVSPFRC